MKIIGHRAGACLFPENSLLGIQACLSSGFGVEIDVRILQGSLYLMHDATLERTAQGTNPAGARLRPEIHLKFEEKVFDLPAVSEPLPQAQIAFHLIGSSLMVNDQVSVFVEIKGSDWSIVEKTWALIESSGLRECAVVFGPAVQANLLAAQRWSGRWMFRVSDESTYQQCLKSTSRWLFAIDGLSPRSLEQAVDAGKKVLFGGPRYVAWRPDSWVALRSTPIKPSALLTQFPWHARALIEGPRID